MVNVVFLVFLWYLLLKPIKVYISFASVFHISINATTIDFTGSGKLGLPTKALLKKMGGVDIAKSISCLMKELILEFLAVFTISVMALLIVAYPLYRDPFVSPILVIFGHSCCCVGSDDSGCNLFF